MALNDPADPDFALKTGDLITRRELASRFGGGTQSGIETPHGKPYIFAFSDLRSGRKHGYVHDGWSPDGSTFFYTGAGQIGPQLPRTGNKALIQAAELGKQIHLFTADSMLPGTGTRLHRYLGEFAVDPARPYRSQEGLDREGASRTVMVFHLKPVSSTEKDLSLGMATTALELPASTAEWSVVAPEASNVFGSPRSRTEEGFASRRERQFEDGVIAALVRSGKTAARIKIVVSGQSGNLYTDTWVEEDRELFEAKADATRNHIRMAVAQLLDYSRHIDPKPARLTVVVPIEPIPDLVDFVKRQGIGVAVLRQGEQGKRPVLVRL